jgi:hypothetical protein
VPGQYVDIDNILVVITLQTEHKESELMTEKVQWSEEKASLSLHINRLEKQVNSLKDDLRRAEIDLEREQEKYYKPQNDSSGQVDKQKVCGD